MLCVIAKLPSEADERLRRLLAAVLQENAADASLYGHITVATYLPEDDGPFVRACSEMLRGCRSFAVRYETIRTLSETSVIAAIPGKNSALASLHRKIAKEYGPFLDRWTCGDEWVPHTTLMHDPAADLERICREMNRIFVPFETRIGRIEFSRVGEDGFRILDSVTLE